MTKGKASGGYLAKWRFMPGVPTRLIPRADLRLPPWLQVGARLGKMVVMAPHQASLRNWTDSRGYPRITFSSVDLQCDCGRSVTKPVSTMRRLRDAAHCGCVGPRMDQGLAFRANRLTDTSGVTPFEVYFVAVMKNAQRRGLAFSLVSNDVRAMLIEQKHRCALTGVSIARGTDASIDRIDNKEGYTPRNVWWVHKEVNRLKNDFDLKEFLYWCNKLVAHERVKYRQQKIAKIPKLPFAFEFNPSTATDLQLVTEYMHRFREQAPFSPKSVAAGVTTEYGVRLTAVGVSGVKAYKPDLFVPVAGVRGGFDLAHPESAPTCPRQRRYRQELWTQDPLLPR